VDEIDVAQDMEELHRGLSISKIRALTQEEEDPLMINGRRHCLDCEEPIPRARLWVHPAAVRCTGCQGRKERRS